ncbi:MAG: calcium/proton exchanger [Acidobacteriota bacterium]|nr:calcium/proton exchanger [Acidobacteriota bacterium]
MIFAGLLLFIPISLALAYGFHAPPLWIFAAGGAAIIPLAEWIRRATDHLANRAGPAIGGLLNITFGSVAELTLALFVLAKGHPEVVKAQITGSLIGTSLLGLGIAIVVGGWKREKQTFPREKAGLLGSLLILSVIALLVPALFNYTERGLYAGVSKNPGALNEKLSICVSVVLIVVYLTNLIYTLVTHRDVFSARKQEKKLEEPIWPLWKSLAVLFAATAFVALESDLLSGSLGATAGQLGLTPLFLGVVVLALIGNAADIMAATYFARQDQMGLVMGICVGSTVQVAMVLAPILVLISYVMGHPINLVFTNPLELIAVVGTVFAVNSIASDGETTWFEGVLLIAVYTLFGLAFFFATP